MTMHPVNSSAISAVGYNSITQQLHIKFKQGRTYHFCRVPENVYSSLMSAKSKGRFYDSYIKDRYQC